MIRFNDLHAIRLVTQAANIQYVPRLHYCIADYDTKDCIRGGVMYTDVWGGGSLQMHVAGFQKNWASKALLWLAFDLPFNKIKVKKVFGLVPEYNVAARNFDVHLGFTIEHFVEDVFNRPDRSNGMFIMGMRKKDCKWLDMPHPRIEFASKEQTNSFRQLLETMEPVGTVQ